MNKKIESIILGIMCLILTYGISVQIKTVNSINSNLTTNAVENDLRDQILKTKEKYDNALASMEKEQETIEKEREKATNNNQELEDYEKQIKEKSKMLGLTEVTGPGVIVILRDSQNTNSSIDISSQLVHDFDVLSVVNELKNAGAEAISINDNRIVSTTSILCSGNVIEVNNQKVGTPFEIKAIGLPEQLSALSRPGGYLSKLEQYGIETELEKSNNITIPKYAGALNFKYAQTEK